MKPDILHGDFETRSTVDLRAAGVYIYAGHPTTDAWCMSWAFNDEPVAIWKRGEPLPERVRKHIAAGGEFHAHNAGFEWAIWNGVMAPRYGWSQLRIEQCYCTAAMAAAMGLPRDLAGAAAALGLQYQKDMKGHTLMMQMARPRKIAPCHVCTGDGLFRAYNNRVIAANGRCPECQGAGQLITWWDELEKRERLYQYCMIDLEAEREAEGRMLPLSPQERAVWLLDHKINSRGIRVDLPQVRAIERVVEHAMPKLDKQIAALTNHDVTACTQVARLVKWLNSRGIETASVNKESITDLLEEDIPEDVEQVLMLRLEASKVSTSKLDTMQTCASRDGRVRGAFLYHGAGPGRWSSMRLQLHNLPRPQLKHKEVEQVLPHFLNDNVELAARSIEMIWGSPVQVASDCLRSLLIADQGKDLLAADFANIEGRVLAVLAGQDDLVETFRADGPVYEQMAAAIYSVPVSTIIDGSLERQLGKQAVLGCGYGMGHKKFRGTCKKYNIRIDQALAERAVNTYREKNHRIKAFWYAIEDAAIRAVERPGEVVAIRGVPDFGIRYRKSGSFLWCKLPSGRMLCYPYPRVAEKETPWGEMRPALFCKGVDSTTKQWVEYNPYGGLLTENVVQATARDLLAAGMLRVERAGYPVVLHVHDEIVCEVPKGFGDLGDFENLMGALPAWAKGWPVKAKGWRGERYRK